MGKKKTLLGLQIKKEENFGDWYQEVVTKSEMIDYYKEVSGCYILRPWSFEIWERIQAFMDGNIKTLGVKNCYFPMFVTEKQLGKEADHIEDFAPEVAWVTRSGDTELEQPIAIRPTSETIMYPYFSKWIRSHRDLPLRLNQWTNVVRWEFKLPRPFVRTREFLWQEGHTAFETKEEADKEVIEALDIYARVYEEMLAVPVIKGRKSCKEKFPGGDFTTTVEAYIPASGRSIQAATSHSLGQNFSKMFDIMFKDRDHNEQHVWQNSWGCTTRSIGVMIMVHSDNTGLVLPPRVAPVQVVGITIPTKEDSKNEAMLDRLSDLLKEMNGLGLHTFLDDRADKNPGWKFNYHEQKGVPVRVELGPSDMDNDQVVLCIRHDGRKETVATKDAAKRCAELMDIIQNEMLAKARKERDEHLSICWTWDEFAAALDLGNLVLVPWCLHTSCEEDVKDETKRLGEEKAQEGITGLTGAAKTLCHPFSQQPLPENTKCFRCDKNAVEWCLWGRSY